MEVTVKKLCKLAIVYKIAPSGNSELAGRKIVGVANVGDRNAFLGICTLSEYFPSSFMYCILLFLCIHVLYKIRLQKESRSVIDFCCVQCMRDSQCFFSGPDNPQQLPLLMVPWPLIVRPPQTPSRSVQPFFAGLMNVNNMDHDAPSVVIGRISLLLQCSLTYAAPLVWGCFTCVEYPTGD